MCTHPTWIGGERRFDTELMRSNPGRLIAKEGADGLLAVAFAARSTEPEGGAERENGAEREGGAIVVKLAGGQHPEWALLAAQPFLRARGFAVPSAAPSGQDVVWHAHPERREPSPVDVSPALDANLAVWPGDVPFRRAITAQIGTAATDGPAWELTVSSIQTTLHIGAHADAPNHFTPDAIGIDQVPLTPYRGLCQVIALSKPRGSLITPEDLNPDTYPDRRLRAARVLFCTGSFPDPERFNEDFVAFAAETLRWLEARGVVLVGLDTPSVDPFHSKELPAHHATREGVGLAILEGLVLEHVPAGLYELLALPLKLRAADASPVRAVLWPLR
jgi:arylformamidase